MRETAREVPRHRESHFESQRPVAAVMHLDLTAIGMLVHKIIRQ
jgi:hypothetical protein